LAALLLLTGMVFAAGCKEEVVGPGGSVGIGELAIDFNLPNQFGGTTTMSDYRGQVILLTISALWCVPCREEAEHAEALYQDLVGQGFITLEVLVDDETIGGDRASVEDARGWAEEYGITFPVMADIQGNVDQIYGMGALPVNVVIDRGFVVRNIFLGYDEEELRAAIEALL
jgi:peroxiredoxin